MKNETDQQAATVPDNSSEKEELPAAPSARLRWFRFFQCFLVFVLIFLGADLFLETAGISPVLVQKTIRVLFNTPVTFRAESIKAGFFRGLKVRNGVLCLPDEKILFQADMLQLRIRPETFNFRLGIPLHVILQNGSFALQGTDLELKHIYAEMATVNGVREIRYFSAVLKNLHISLTGKIENVLHLTLSRILTRAGNSILRHSTAVQDAPGEATGASIISDLMKRAELSGILSGGTAFCKGFFFLDLSSFSRCFAALNITFPPFYGPGGLKVDTLRERIVLKNGIFQMGRMDLILADRSRLSLAGKYNSTDGTLSGDIQGLCAPADLLVFLGNPAKIIRRNGFYFGEKPSFIQGELHDFHPPAGALFGKVDLKIPEMKFRNIRLHSVELSVVSTHQNVSGRLRRAEILTGGNVTGNFLLENGVFTYTLSGEASAEEMLRLLPNEAKEVFRKQVRFSADARNLTFQGTIADGKTIKGDFEVVVSNVQFRDFHFRRLSCSLSFDEEVVRLHKISGTLEDGSFITGDMIYRIRESDLSAHIVCSGSPEKLLESAGGAYLQRIKEITSGITWPKGEDIIEGSVEIHRNFSDRPTSWFSGTIAMRNFAYNKIPFQFGAAQFILDDNGTFLLPQAVLQSRKGLLNIRAVCEAPKLNEKGEKHGLVNFDVESTLPGDDLMTLFYARWLKGDDAILFPFSTRVKGHGQVDYLHPERTLFHAQITDGSCLWNGIKIDDLDVKLACRGYVVSFTGAEGNACGGRVRVDYSYDVHKERGNVQVDLKNANLESMMDELKIRKLLGNAAQGAGLLSGSTALDFRFDEKEVLQLFGTGEMMLSGDQLWRTPVLGSFLNQLEDAWPVVNMASIRKIRSRWTFRKDRLTIDELSSDGNVVSLGATGWFRWDTSEYDIQYTAELLQGALPFKLASKVLTPVSWIFTRNFHGKLNDYRE